MVGFSRHKQKTFLSLPEIATQPFPTKTRTITKLKSNWVRSEMLQTLGGVIPRFVSRSWLRNLTVRAMAFSSSSSDYGDQSRGGLPRFYSETLPPSKGSVIRVQGDEFWHMTKVLRLTTNDRVQLFNGKGSLVEGCIQSIDRTGLDFVALNDLISIPPQNTQLHVFAGFGTLKGGRADWLVEKCTEFGANSVTPLLTERSPSISENRVDRLKRVILAASKQSQRLHEMVLKHPIEIDDLLHLIAQSKLSLVATAKATPVLSALASLEKETSGLIIIGPEGDFTEKEVSMMMEAGATAVSLGPHRLRVETATIALLATVMLWSDSQQISVC
ncbi:Ribosomal RNA small subunit methyltransferase E [Glycine soja]|uniref:16S rRNA (uracil(1498)-N(3))-methyltransferase n=2 Tax=Glycine soja TaxID=3848 RepID=A0A445F4S6_GLYSO|nr:Ribosomal RNA small subunit methyltransferase E [Glycine soja]